MQYTLQHHATEAHGFNPWVSRAHPRQRGIAMLLVLIAVAIATVLSMSFLASQATTHGVAQNVQKHAQARSVAESALVAAIQYVQTDSNFRTDKTNGQWVTNVSFNGGTFDLFGYDGLDTDGDGVVDETDGDLADDPSDPVTITAIGYFDGVSHTVHAVVTVGSSLPAKTVLMIVNNDNSLDAIEQARIDEIEGWGWAVNILDDNSTPAEYNAAMADADAILVAGTVNANSVSTKLLGASVGVVIEQGGILDDMKIATGSGSYTGTNIDVVNNSHYITSEFNTGSIQICSSDTALGTPSGGLASGMITLGERPSSSTTVVAILESGAPLYGSGIAAGRRVWLPTGTLALSDTTSQGRTLFQRALQWASGGDADEFISGHWTLDDATGLTAYDSSGNGQHGPITAGSPSTTWTAGMIFGGLQFDGTGDGFIRIPDSDVLDLSAEGTLAAWVYLTDYQNFMGIIHKGEDKNWSDEAYSLQFWTSRKLAMSFTTATGSELIVGNQALQNGRWYHVVGTWGPNGMYLYVNGEQDASNAITAVGVPSTGSVQIGSQLSENYNASYRNFPFRGIIDDARIYRRTLTANEVKAIYDAANASHDAPQMIALYEFEETTQAPVVVGQWKLDDTSASGVTYDYAVASQGVNAWAYDGQSSSNPPGNNTTPSAQLNVVEYDKIEADDGATHSINTSSNNNYSMMRYVWQINEDEADVFKIDIEWIGRNYNEHGSREDGVELYIWNYSSGSYEELADSGNTESQATLTASISSNTADYIGGASDNTITLLAKSRDRQSSSRDNILYCDYVRVILNGGLIATDSQDDNDGTVSGGVTAAAAGMGDGGTAFHFDGSTGLVTIPNDDSINFPNDFSLSGWFKLDSNFNSSKTTSQIIMSKYQSNNYDMLLVLAGTDYGHASPPDGSLVFKIEGGNSTNDTNYVWTNRTNWTAGQWYHFTAVLDSNYAPNNKIYINGVDDSGGFYNGVGSDELSLDFDADLTIGGGRADSGQLSGLRYFDGVIDDVRLVGQVLTDSQIAELASVSEPSPDTIPVAYDTSGYSVPLNLDVQVPSNVTWVPGGGLTFDAATRLVSSTAATKLYDALTANNQMAIEIIFTPANTSQSGPARIVSYSGGSSNTNFTFGQDADACVARLDTTSTTGAGTPEVDSGPLLLAGVEQHLILSYDGENLTIYSNDGTSTTLARTGDFDWDNAFDLLMGNEAVDGYEWLGTLRRVAIYDKAFNQTQADNVFNGDPPGDGSASGAGGVDWIEP